MRDPLPRFFSRSDPSGGFSEGESWLSRVRENLAQVLTPSHFKPSSANGAPIHLLNFDKTLRPARAQGASVAAHLAILLAIVFFLTQSAPIKSKLGYGPYMPLPAYRFPTHVLRSLVTASSDGAGQSGAKNPIPTTSGDIRRAAIQIVRPSLPEKRETVLPVAPTILDPKAANVTPAADIGLPWMPAKTDSGGPGKGHGLGSKDGDTAGDGGRGIFGEGYNNAPYSPGVTEPYCAYCPPPSYTDDARHAKVQGAVTLQVLVGIDGRAQDVRIMKGIGFGLDDRAIETIRSWKFVPARDASKNAIAAWITVETVYRLY